jgi:hypothetical protein
VIDYAVGPADYVIGHDHRLYSGVDTLTNIAVNGVGGWQRVVTGSGHTMVVDDNGQLWEWYRFRQPEGPTLVPFPKPITNWLDVAVTSTFAMALSADGELYAWGVASPGVWADPNASAALVPELVRGLPNLLDPNATDTAAEFLSTSITPTSLTVRLTAPAGLQLPIQTSTDLIHWAPYSTLQSQPGITSSDLPINPAGAQFFRIGK